MSETLHSRKNPRVKALRSLHDRKGREAAGTFLVEGVRGVEAALLAGRLREAWCSPKLARSDRGRALRACLEARRTAGADGAAGAAVIELIETEDEILDWATEARGSQGVLGLCDLPTTAPDPVGHHPADLVILADLQDPGNTGTIWRSLAASGGGVLVCGDRGADPYAPKVLRAAAGAVFYTPALRTPVDEELLERLRTAGFRLIATAVEDPREGQDARDYREADWTGPLALLIGQEGPGLPQAWIARSDLVVRIPMARGIESLNAAQSATLLLYERMRVRSGRALEPCQPGGTLGSGTRGPS